MHHITVFYLLRQYMYVCFPKPPISIVSREYIVLHDSDNWDYITPEGIAASFVRYVHFKRAVCQKHELD